MRMLSRVPTSPSLHSVKMSQREATAPVLALNMDVMALCKGGKLKEVLCILDRVNQPDVGVRLSIYACLLQQCINMKALAEGKRIHDHIVSSGLNSSMFLLNVLINMYAKCGSMEDACQLFSKMPERDVASWNIIIAGYARHGHSKKAFQMFSQMQEEGMKPDKFTFISILKVCVNQATLAQGKQIHSLIVLNGCESDVYVGSTLVNMYSKCGSVVDARQVFDKMPKRNVVSWNAMLAGYAQHGHGAQAFKLFWQMQQEGLKPDKVTLVILLNVCAALAALDQGKQIHAHIINSGCETDVFVGNTLVNMYAKCGRLMDAQLVFKRMTIRNVVSWNVMIAGYIQNGYNEEALRIFSQMQQEGAKPDKITFISVLNACTNLTALEQGKEIHASLRKSGFEWDIAVENSLINMYAKCGRLLDAYQTFNNMPKRNVMSWNIMISGYAQHGQGEQAFEFYQQMQCTFLKPDKITFASLLVACISLTALDKGKQIHAEIIKGELESDLFVGSLLVSMYAKCGSLVDAWQVFIKMPKRDVVSWNTMITSYIQYGHCKEAYKLFLGMQQEGIKPNKVTFIVVLNACANLAALEHGKQIHSQIIKSGCESDLPLCNTLLDMYAKCGSMKHAYQVFEKMPERDVVSWNVMISGYAQQGNGEGAVRFYQHMQREGIKPDHYTFVAALNACSSLAALEQGKHIHAHIIESGLESDVFVNNTLISMYAKCGSVVNARQVFDKMPERRVVSWTAMIAGYAQHGHSEEALKTFCQMQQEGVKPDEITFIGVLSACNYAGLVDEGYHYFDSICRDHGIIPIEQHYTCMVDLLSRAGELQAAEQLIQKMPFQPSAAVWMALLGNSRVHADLERARCVAECILELEPENAPAFVLLSNLYAAAGRWDDKGNIRRMMDDRDGRKEPVD